MVRSRVGKSGGRYIVKSPKTPPKNPPIGSQNQARAAKSRGTTKAPKIASVSPRNIPAIARRLPKRSASQPAPKLPKIDAKLNAKNAADTNCVIPDSSYAAVYDETIAYFKKTGALNPATAGTVQNIGLMAQKAEEYGSHPTTFEIAADGVVRMIAANGDVLHQHNVEKGDIWRAASTRKAPIEDWVRLAIDRQKAEGCQAIFWLDASRAHDAELIKYVTPILAAAGVAHKFQILAPREATRLSLETIRKGETSIAVTGNVLRDYLTDLFPILELGTSAKMLSIVKLMNGGGLFETGAGGSAP